METAQVFIDWWMDKKMWYINTVKFYSAIKKNEILPFATTCIDLEGLLLSKISQRKTNTIQFHSYVEFKKQNKQAKGKKGREVGKSRNKLLTIESKVMVTRREVGEEDGWNTEWILRSALVMMCTGWCMEVLGYCVVYLNLILHSILTNWNLNKNLINWTTHFFLKIFKFFLEKAWAFTFINWHRTYDTLCLHKHSILFLDSSVF